MKAEEALKKSIETLYNFEKKYFNIYGYDTENRELVAINREAYIDFYEEWIDYANKIKRKYKYSQLFELLEFHKFKIDLEADFEVVFEDKNAKKIEFDVITLFSKREEIKCFIELKFMKNAGWKAKYDAQIIRQLLYLYENQETHYKYLYVVFDLESNRAHQFFLTSYFFKNLLKEIKNKGII